MKSLLNQKLIRAILFLTIFTSCINDSDKNENNQFDEESTKIDTFNISTNLDFHVIKNKDEIQIQCFERKNKNVYLTFEIYNDGSLKSMQNIKGEKLDTLGGGMWVVNYNIQSLKLDTNGFVMRYFLSRDYQEITSGEYTDSTFSKRKYRN